MIPTRTRFERCGFFVGTGAASKALNLRRNRTGGGGEKVGVKNKSN
jgi:hypothetical protein